LLSPSKLKDRLFYGWVVVIAFFAIQAILYGSSGSFGVFFKSIAGEFGLSRATTSAVSSVSMLFYCVFSVLGGWALDRYGPRIVVFFTGLFAGLSLLLTSQVNATWQLFITYSLLLAMGSGPAYAVAMSTVSRWFDKKRGLAVGITASGGGLGLVVMAPFAAYLIYNLDWRMAYIVMGLIVWVVIIPLSRLLKRDPQEIGALPDGIRADSRAIKDDGDSIQPFGLSVLQVFRTRSFWLLIPIWLVHAFCMFLVSTHIVPHTTDIGFSAGEAAVVLSLIGGIRAVGAVLLGSVADRVGKKRMAVVCTLFMAGAMVWLVWAQDLWMLYLFALVYGFAQGGLSSCIAVLIGDTFGLGKIGSILGVLDVGFAIGAAAGSFIGGLIFDINNSYSVAFFIAAAAMVTVALLLVPIRRETGRNF